MALEFAIFDSTGRPEKWVEMASDEHEELFALAGERPILRFSDYYGDAAFTAAEVPELRRALEAIVRDARASAPLRACLTALNALLLDAESQGQGISVLAD